MASPKVMIRDERWSEILEEAANAFATKGYDATTVEEIAARVGLLKGSLYYYIENKADLLYQVASRLFNRFLAALEAESGITEGDAVSRLYHFVDRYMRELDSFFLAGELTRRDFIFLDPEHLAAINASRHQIDLMLKRILHQGITEGVFDPDMDVSVATNGILSLMNGTNLWRRPTGRRSSQEIADWYKTLLTDGIRRRADDPVSVQPLNP
jgi:TetR/AcrR family transcriptional regulator, cholesterol catabolism regulator